jgi:hypothetical protein
MPDEPGRAWPGRLDRKMCSASVEPSPSRISTPNRSRNRWNSTGGSGSPAEIPCRTDEKESSGTSEFSSAE